MLPPAHSTHSNIMAHSRSFKTVPIVLDLSSPIHGFQNADQTAAEKVLFDLLPPSPDSPKAIVPDGKTLRRKKHLSVIRISTLSDELKDSALRMPRPESTPPTTTRPDPVQKALAGVKPDATHVRSYSQPNTSVKLGHPRRPLYEAIRPRPTSAIGLPPSALPGANAEPNRDSSPPSRPSSLVLPSSGSIQFSRPNRRRSAFLDVDIPGDLDADDIALPTPSVLSPPAASSAGATSSSAGYSHLPFGLGLTPPGAQSGFGHSTSGETEMKMALASKTSSTGDASSLDRSSDEGGYRFTAMAMGKKPSGNGSMKKHLKRWSRGIKDLLK